MRFNVEKIEKKGCDKDLGSKYFDCTKNICILKVASTNFVKNSSDKTREKGKIWAGIQIHTLFEAKL